MNKMEENLETENCDSAYDSVLNVPKYDDGQAVIEFNTHCKTSMRSIQENSVMDKEETRKVNLTEDIEANTAVLESAHQNVKTMTNVKTNPSSLSPLACQGKIHQGFTMIDELVNESADVFGAQISTSCHMSYCNDRDTESAKGKTKSSTKSPSATSDNPVDGLFAWIVTLSAFTIGVILGGLSWSFGLLFKELLEYYNENRNTISWIQSVQNGIFLLIGPVTGYLITRFDCRRVGMTGSVILFTALLASSFAPNVPALIAFYGLIGGMGCGLLYMPSITVVGLYFKKRRALATSIVCSGSSVGGFAFAPITQLLLDRYGWRGSLLILSAICFNGLALSAIFRPVDIIIKETETVVTSKATDVKTGDGVKEKAQEICKDTASFSGVICSLLKNTTFVCFALSGFFGMFSFYVPLMYIPQLTDSIGMPSSRGQFFVSTISMSNTIARVVIGVVLDRKLVDPVHLFAGVLIFGGVTTMCIKYFTSFVLMMIYCIVFGIAGAAFITLRSIILMDLFGAHLLPHTLGLAIMFQGVAAFIGPPIIGAVIDATEDHLFGFFVAGASLTLSGILMIRFGKIRRWWDLVENRAIINTEIISLPTPLEGTNGHYSCFGGAIKGLFYQTNPPAVTTR